MKKGIFQVFSSNVIFMIFGALTNFLLPKFLSIDSYASIRTYLLYTSYAGLLTFGFTEGMYIKYGGHSFHQVIEMGLEKNRSTMIAFQGGIALAIGIIGAFVQNKILVLVAIGVFSTNISNYFLNFATAIGDFKTYSILTSFSKITNFIFNLVLIFFVGTDSAVLYIGLLIIIELVMAVYYLAVMKDRGCSHFIQFRFYWSEAKYCIGTGFVLMIGNMMSNIFVGIDQWFVKLLMTTHDFAMYSFAISMERMITLLISPISLVLYNAFCKKMSDEKRMKILEYSFIWSMLLIASVFPMKLIVQLFIPNYSDAINVGVVLFVGQVVSCLISCIYINAYKALKMQKQFMVQMIKICMISIAMNSILYFLFRNMISIAIGTLLTKLIWLYLCERELPDYSYSIKQNLVLLALLIVGIVAGIFLSVFAGIALFAVAYITLLFLFFRSRTIELIREVFSPFL